MKDDGILKAELERAVEECQRLRQENADLRETTTSQQRMPIEVLSHYLPRIQSG